MSKIILRCDKLAKTYREGKLITPVLSEVDFVLKEREQVAIVGSSGSGKSTLLHVLAGLDKASAGQVELMGQDLAKLSANERGCLRNRHCGFVYQFHYLLPEFSALENVAMPLLIRKVKLSHAKDAARDILDHVGLAHRLNHKPSELSGGERQRVAIARALVTKPTIVMADEPTGNLDNKTADAVYKLLLDIHKEFDVAFLIVTHDEKLANKMERVLHLENGECLNELLVTSS